MCVHICTYVDFNTKCCAIFCSASDVCQGGGYPGDAQEAEGGGHLLPPYDDGAGKERAGRGRAEDLLLLPQPVRERENRSGRSGHSLTEIAGHR